MTTKKSIMNQWFLAEPDWISSPKSLSITTERLDCIEDAQTRKIMGHLMNLLIVAEAGETFSTNSLSKSLMISMRTRAGL